MASRGVLTPWQERPASLTDEEGPPTPPLLAVRLLSPTSVARSRPARSLRRLVIHAVPGRRVGRARAAGTPVDHQHKDDADRAFTGAPVRRYGARSWGGAGMAGRLTRTTDGVITLVGDFDLFTAPEIEIQILERLPSEG